MLVSLLVENYSIIPNLQRIKEKDSYTYCHSLNVSLISTMIGKWLDMSGWDLKQVAYAGLFHDLGK